MATIENTEPIEAAFARLREAPLEAADGEDVRIYMNATMRVADFYPDELNLTSLYVLKPTIAQLEKLRAELLQNHAVDILRHGCILHVRTDDGKLIGTAPPFVEIYEEQVWVVKHRGERTPPSPVTVKIPILKDGIHRAWIARALGIPLRCIVVSGALPQYRPYAYPNGWSQVQLYDEKPPLKKYYRREEPYSFMRPLKVLRQTSAEPVKAEWGR